MAEIIIASAGRAKGTPEAELVAAYLRRLPWRVRVIEIEERRRLDASARRESESQKLLGALPEAAFLVCLDERGKEVSSEGFAAVLTKWQERADILAFVIGGADGLSDTVRARANALMSLSRMTWPHLMVRAMLAEQLYRAFAINSGHPYHRG